jgi:hypothetical protein
MEPIVQFEDALVAVRTVGLDGQQILIQATPWGETLARLLSGKEPVRENGFFVVFHDPEVDARLCELVDTFTTIRWAHPTFTQLVLDLQVEGTG